MKKKFFMGVLALLTAIMFSCNYTANAQATYTVNSSKTTTNLYKGAVVVDSIQRMPIHDTIPPSWYPSRFLEGSVVYRNADSSLYYHNGEKWLRATRETYTATATLNFPSTNTLRSADLTITVTGAELNDYVTLGSPNQTDANTTYTAFVSAANTVTVRFNNYSASTVDPASATFKVLVTK